MRLITFACGIVAVFHCLAQTGPGGIGSSTNNVLWLDANSGVTRVGTAVSQWNDRSGNSNHALLPATIPTAKPTFVAASVNGYPSLDFDGSDDQLWVSHNANLSLTAWHFFIVVTADLQKDYNAWMVKGDDGDENYEMLSYSDGNIHTPIKWSDNTRTFPSSAAGQVTTTNFNIIEYSFTSSAGRKVYNNASSIISDSENKTPKTNTLPLYIGNERSTTGRCMNGDLAEVIAFNAPVNSAQRIIVNNYLAAKYGRTLSANDIYVQDNAANGNYDHDVAGIGRVNNTNQQTDSRGSGIVRINNATNLGNDEFLIWGHNNGTLGTWGVSDRPAGVQGRWARVWRMNEVSSSGAVIDVGNVDVSFDLTGFTVGNASHLRLLVDLNNNGVFADDTPISGATAIGGGLYRFSGVSSFGNNIRFTLGTTSLSQTPLPIELLSFQAKNEGDGRVRLDWATASEQDNEAFTVERSSDGVAWQEVVKVPGATNSNQVLNYSAVDADAKGPVCYYRLRQTDLDGTSTLSDVVAVDLPISDEQLTQVFPNPSSGPFTVSMLGLSDEVVSFAFQDAAGRVLPVAHHRLGAGLFEVDPGPVPSGSYVLRAMVSGESGIRTVQVVR